MTTPIHLREGGSDDIGALMRVMVRAFDPAFGEAWNRGQCLGIMSLPDVWLSFAEATEDGVSQPVGFALSRLLMDEAELLLLAVDPDWRQRGVASALIDRTAMNAAARGAHRLLLEVRDGNQALCLYQRQGFGQIGRRRDYYRGGDGSTHDALTLARPIG
ncbi:GNAT family N-acetyltransferase [Sphingomonas sp. MMS24-J13]|uniref:GNAT family N-acetyltransferase n=1 Tax=Sphingomonas sp. MMS24-J13 TaxID=3238686 RepID=UPI00384E1926